MAVIEIGAINGDLSGLRRPSALLPCIKKSPTRSGFL